MDPTDAVAGLAYWSEWVPFGEALASAPRLPGVYLAREGLHGPIVYVGMAGERAGSGKPQGIRGRLSIYTRGKGLASGLGEAVLDRALADSVWLRERLLEVERGDPARAATWGRLAFERADLHVCWTVTPDKASALALELACIEALADVELWNRRR